MYMFAYPFLPTVAVPGSDCTIFERGCRERIEMGQIRNGTPASLPILGQSTLNKDRIVALLKPSLHAYGEMVAFRFH